MGVDITEFRVYLHSASCFCCCPNYKFSTNLASVLIRIFFVRWSFFVSFMLEMEVLSHQNDPFWIPTYSLGEIMSAIYLFIWVILSRFPRNNLSLPKLHDI